MISLDSLPDPARQAFQGLQAENARLAQALQAQDKIIQLQDEKIRLLNLRLWGPKGEKLSPAQTALLFQEASVTAAEVQQEAQRPAPEKENPLPKAKAPRLNHPGREKLPAHLERREVILPCRPQDCRCEKCGAERPVIGYDSSEELVCEPATFYVRVTKREKRGSHCLEEQGVATAPAPAKIVPKSKLSNEFIIEALAQKYQQHLPVYRQCAVLADNHGIELSRKTVTESILAAGNCCARWSGRKRPIWFAVPICKPTKRPCRCRRAKKPGATIKPTCGNSASRAGRSSLTFKWGAGAKGRKLSCGVSRASCNATATASMTNWAKASSMSAAWPMPGAALWTRPNWRP